MIRVSAIRKTVQEIIELSAKSAILADSKSKLFCQQYAALEEDSGRREARRTFLSALGQDYGLKTKSLFQMVNSLASQNSDQTQFDKSFRQPSFNKLNAALRPDYYTLFSNLGRVKDGVSTLVRIRADILDLLENKRAESLSSEAEENLRIMNSILKQLLSLWFTTGLLDIEQITWRSPAVLVEKVAHYESVHQVRTLNDLKNRLGSSRRCFIYTHSTMPNEPLVILHIALTNTISSNIASLIKNKPSSADSSSSSSSAEEEKTNAIFYSINSCQKGLREVELGNSLIKSCVKLLLQELPGLRDFHTLSPIPKFKEWLDLQFATSTPQSGFFSVEQALTVQELTRLGELFEVKDDRARLVERLRAYLNSPAYKSSISRSKSELGEADYDGELQQIVSNFMLRSCAFYLYNVKKNGFAFNAVCNFHIKNGAQIYRVNYGADLSDNGLKSSYGMMVNYGYYLNDLDSNSIKYLTEKAIRISPLVSPLLANFKPKL